MIAATAHSAKEKKVWISTEAAQGRQARDRPEWFTGTVRVDPLFEAPEPARARAASVTFEPGARTAWHTHPLGQALIVTFGLGWVQRWGGPIEEIRPGDVIWFAAGEKHWHRGNAHDGNDTYRYSGSAERQARRLDGARERRAIPKVSPVQAATECPLNAFVRTLVGPDPARDICQA